MKKFGIVSGMGAAAGVHFYDTLIKEYQKNGATTDSDFPEVILHNVPTRGLNKHGVSNSMVLVKELVGSIEMLNRCGAEVIMIACNSAHMNHQYLQMMSKARILNMVEIAADSIGVATRVGVISSESTKESRLYEDILSRRGINVIQTTPEQQQMVDGMIEKAISGRINDKHRQKLAYIMRSMIRRGADEIILGCTELPLIGNPFGLCIDAGKKMIERAVTL
jgi:aspartate racemase